LSPWSTFSSCPIPRRTVFPNNFISLFLTGILNPRFGDGSISYFNEVIDGANCLVVEYDQIRHGSSSSTGTITGQIIMCEDSSITLNCIDCQVDNTHADNYGTSGIENEIGSAAAFDPNLDEGRFIEGDSYFACTTFIPDVSELSNCDFLYWVTDLNDLNGSKISSEAFTDVTPTVTTTYYAIMECNNGKQCVDEVTITIDPATSFNQERISLCDNAKYTLSDGSIVSTAGVYTSVIIDELGCERITETTVIIDEAFQVTQEESICEGSTFLLPDGTEVSTTGTYETLLNSSFNCDSIVITNLTVSSTSFKEENIRLCENTPYTLPDGSVVSTAGLYTSVLTDEQGCEQITETTINIDDVFEITKDVSICESNTFLLPDGMEVSATGVYETLLNSSLNCDSLVITNLMVNTSSLNQESINLCENANYTLPDGSIVSTAGVYSSILIDEQGCERTTETTIIINDVLEVTQDISICEGNTFLLPDDTEVSAPGIYETLLNSAQNCDSLIITDLEVYTLEIDMNTEVESLPDGVVLQNTITSPNIVSYSWSPANNLSCSDCPNPVATPNETTTYQLTVLDVAGGCTVTAEIKVFSALKNPFVPTAFSPNQDGVNDYFAPLGLRDDSNFQFAIYNRKGEKIYQTNTTQPGWDGTYNNQNQPVGVYPWVLNCIQSDGTAALMSGNVTLIR